MNESVTTQTTTMMITPDFTPVSAPVIETDLSPWMPVAIVFIVIVGVALIMVTLVAIVACSILIKLSKRKQETTSYNSGDHLHDVHASMHLCKV